MERGISLTYLGKYDESMKDFNKVIELNPTSTAYNDRGNCELFMGEYEGALKDFCKSIELEPNETAFFNCCFIYLIQGSYDEAKKNLENAIKLNDNENEPYIWLIQALLTLALEGNLDSQYLVKIQDYYSKTENSQNICEQQEFYFTFGIVAQSLGDYNNSLMAFEQSLTLGNFIPTQNILSKLYSN